MKIKICGLTALESVQACIDNNADYVGFVFVPQSPRYIAPRDAKTLCEVVPKSVKTVALFQNHSIDEILDITNTINADCIQLHGTEDVDFCATLKTLTNKKIIKAIAVSCDMDIVNAYAYDSAVDYILFDAKPPKNSAINGGHGVAFDWQILSDNQDIIARFTKPWFLAGGLTTETFEDAVRQTQAHYYDVSGGVESSKGIKDAEKIREFLSQKNICKNLLHIKN